MAHYRVLDLHAVSKSYGRICALKNINLQIEPNQFVALLGQNGAGKSTLFQLLTGLFNADAGEIRVTGHDIRKNPIPALSSIGVVFQQPTLDLDLTVAGNLRFHCLLHGLSRSDAELRIHDELERFGLSEIKSKTVRSLSGGNRRKVELIRALLHNPSVLLMDEATVGLDPESRNALVAYVSQLCKERQMSVLWSTHIVEEVQSADRVIVLDKGQIIAESTPDKLVEESGVPGFSLADAFLKLITHNKNLGVVYE